MAGPENAPTPPRLGLAAGLTARDSVTARPTDTAARPQQDRGNRVSQGTSPVPRGGFLQRSLKRELTHPQNTLTPAAVNMLEKQNHSGAVSPRVYWPIPPHSSHASGRQPEGGESVPATIFLMSTVVIPRERHAGEKTARQGGERGWRSRFCWPASRRAHRPFGPSDEPLRFWRDLAGLASISYRGAHRLRRGLDHFQAPLMNWNTHCLEQEDQFVTTGALPER